MSGAVALAALATAGAVGVRWLVQARRRKGAAAQDGTAAPAPADDVPHVTPDDADRAVTCIDNGGRPFVVRLSYKKCVATVYLVKWLEDDKIDDVSNVFRSFRFRRAFIGLDPREPRLEEERPRAAAVAATAADADAAAAGAAPRRVWWYGGNSVLLDMGDRRYIFIGMNIFAFTAYDDIHTYVSTMGNSAVPYPYAIGTKNTYFMIEDTYMPNHILKLNGFKDGDDPYDVLYGDELARWLPGTDPKQPLPEHLHRFAAGTRRWQQQFQMKDVEQICDRQM